MKKISTAERAEWRNIWCLLRSIDADEIEEAAGPDFDWPRFRDDPHKYLIRTDQRQSDAIWRAVEKKL